MAMTLEVYRIALRDFIKDKTQYNRLLKFTQENIDDELDMYLNMALGFLNAIPPPVGEFAWATFPIPQLLIHQATIECLISNGIVAARNDLTYNNGGVTVKISDGDRYLKHLQILFRMADLAIANFKQIKVSINISGGWGGVSSPYAWLHGRDGTLEPNSILSG